MPAHDVNGSLDDFTWPAGARHLTKPSTADVAAADRMHVVDELLVMLTSGACTQLRHREVDCHNVAAHAGETLRLPALTCLRLVTQHIALVCHICEHATYACGISPMQERMLARMAGTCVSRQGLPALCS